MLRVSVTGIHVSYYLFSNWFNLISVKDAFEDKEGLICLDKSLSLRVTWDLWGLFLYGHGLVESILPLPAHLIKGGIRQFLTNISLC